MSAGGRDVYLTWDGGSVFLRGQEPDKMGIFVSGDGIEGWDSTPDTKVTLTERQTGDGAHEIEESSILYAARTVTVNFHAHGDSRYEVTGYLRELNAAAHHMITLRVVDDDQDTFVTGYMSSNIEAEWYGNWATGDFTVVCPDPRRYSTDVHRLQMLPNGSASGGLFYGNEGKGLTYPLSYGKEPEALQNVVTLENKGNSASYPKIVVTGPITGGFRFDSSDGSVSFSQSVSGTPLVFDSLTRTANVGGLDQSRFLTDRGFPIVPANGSRSITMHASGTGWATVEWRDTYI